ncbi:MAG: queuosine precursor transporter [Gammaproteobacteria bacterium WSBS_2016_MAG_OTU1]
MRKQTFFYGAGAMALVLALSNYLVLFPLGDWLTYAAFSYPFAFLITDCVNRFAGAACARRVVFVGFAIGVPLSFVFNYIAADLTAQGAMRIAAASGAAFACAQLMDVAIFNRLRNNAWWLPPLASSAPASIVDTFLFFALAFIATDVPWVQLAAGDLAVKAFMLAVLLPPYRLLTFRLSPINN